MSGALANKPGNGGEAWVRTELAARARAARVRRRASSSRSAPRTASTPTARPAPFETCVNREFFERSLAAVAPRSRASLILDGGPATAGLPFDELVDLAAEAELLVNISGHLELGCAQARPRRRAYVDVDPGFTQIWAARAARGAPRRARRLLHGRREHRSRRLPDPDRRHRLAPAAAAGGARGLAGRAAAGRPTGFTTVAGWRSPLGELSHEGATLPGKLTSWRAVIDLPRALGARRSRSRSTSTPATSVTSTRCSQHGWRISDPRAGRRGSRGVPPATSRGSGAEFSAAQGVYVETAQRLAQRPHRALPRLGAAGARPGHRDSAARYPVGEGLLTFGTLDEAVSGADGDRRATTQRTPPPHGAGRGALRLRCHPDRDSSTEHSPRPRRMPLLSEIAGRVLRLPAPATRDVLVERDLPVAMDDGVVLLADRYAPARRRRARRPCSSARRTGARGRSASCSAGCSPSAASRSSCRASRGTFGSGGEFDPFDERDDGLATLRWLRAQPWHDGPRRHDRPELHGHRPVGDRRRGRRAGAVGHRVAVPRHGVRQREHLARHRAVVDAVPRGAGAAARAAAARPRPAAHAAARLRPRSRSATSTSARSGRRSRTSASGSSRWRRTARTGRRATSRRRSPTSRAPVQLTGGWHDIFLPWMIEDFRALRAAGRARSSSSGRGRTRRPALRGREPARGHRAGCARTCSATGGWSATRRSAST